MLEAKSLDRICHDLYTSNFKLPTNHRGALVCVPMKRRWCPSAATECELGRADAWW